MTKRPSSDDRGGASDADRFKFFKKARADDEDLPELYSIFQGEVAELKPYGAFVKIPGLSRKQGLVHKSQISRARVEDPSEIISKGEKVYCKVISVEDGKISLSMKVVNQSNGQDEDSANVELSLDEKKRKQFNKQGRPKIELGAELNTTCKKCGGRGHLAQDCFHVKGGKTYDLVDDVDLSATVPPSEDLESSSKKKKKKEKKKKSKKSKKHRHHRHHSSSDNSDSEKEEKSKKRKHKHKHRKRYSSSSSSG